MQIIVIFSSFCRRQKELPWCGTPPESWRIVSETSSLVPTWCWRLVLESGAALASRVSVFFVTSSAGESRMKSGVLNIALCFSVTVRL